MKNKKKQPSCLSVTFFSDRKYPHCCAEGTQKIYGWNTWICYPHVSRPVDYSEPFLMQRIKQSFIKSTNDT